MSSTDSGWELIDTGFKGKVYRKILDVVLTTGEYVAIYSKNIIPIVCWALVYEIDNDDDFSLPEETRMKIANTYIVGMIISTYKEDGSLAFADSPDNFIRYEKCMK